ncbi:MAG: DUF4783 domain-containing protein [Cytophagales bacterium]|nr:DUF4783 domain-containing protein [Cytophagales bacterium]
MIRYLFFVLTIGLGFQVWEQDSGSLYAQGSSDTLEKIEKAFRWGSSKVLKEHLNAFVSIKWGDKELKKYTQKEAVGFFKDFFQKYPPREYLRIHQGVPGKEQVYAIARYTSTQLGQYRVYLLLKKERKGKRKGKYKIHDLHISEE